MHIVGSDYLQRNYGRSLEELENYPLGFCLEFRDHTLPHMPVTTRWLQAGEHTWVCVYLKTDDMKHPYEVLDVVIHDIRWVRLSSTRYMWIRSSEQIPYQYSFWGWCKQKVFAFWNRLL